MGGLVRTGFSTITTRCVRPSYRTSLVAPGQPVLLWVSGQDRSHPAGVYAEGRTTGVVRAEGDDLVLPVSLTPLEPAVRRVELLAHPLLAQLEVLRMPAGSNPSYVTEEQLEALRAGWPQVTVGADRRL